MAETKQRSLLRVAAQDFKWIVFEREKRNEAKALAEARILHAAEESRLLVATEAELVHVRNNILLITVLYENVFQHQNCCTHDTICTPFKNSYPYQVLALKFTAWEVPLDSGWISVDHEVICDQTHRRVVTTWCTVNTRNLIK